MKEVLLFELKNCPYCKRIHRFLEELYEKNPNYRNINIKIIDERKEKELANKYDYYLVPSLFIDGKKVHEGKMRSAEELEKILKEVL